jgi:integrase
MGIFKRQKDYWIDYYIQGRRRQEKIGPSKKLAQAVLAKRKIQIAEQKYLDIQQTPACKFEDLAREYTEYSRVNKRSHKTSGLYNIIKLTNYFKGEYLHQITPLDIEKFKAKSLQSHKPATVNRELACLKHMFSKAIEWGKAVQNPARGIKLLAENNQRTRYLTRREYELLMAYANSPLRPILELAVHTGMRLSEIRFLKWSDVNLAKALIFIRQTKNNYPRDIPLTSDLLDMLTSLPKHLHSPYIFAKLDGEVMGKNWITDEFRKVAKKAGITDIRFHDLRHTFAS